ncbi:DAK2 domain-containing protein [Holzapfeliella sp. He02]|uniref:DAK2 domain-containing protein n=1 Tax=Holzapfeliella saturejae TaxID=3082953 RepID=A0ABU8SGR4_9LACO
MVVTEINSAKFRDMVRIATYRLNKNAEFVDSLNVFPVPDGDTGTNMNLTVQSGEKAVNESNGSQVGELTAALAKGMLMGARGNSGVILSQLFRGFSKKTEDKEVLDSQALADAFVGGVETAYKAVMKPVEGTILTVARQAARAGQKKATETSDVNEVMQAVVEGAHKSLQQTPELLPVLKEVGVVDSGGQGLLFVYQGFLEALTGENVSDLYQPDKSEMDEMVNAAHHQGVQPQISTQEIHFGYCTEMMIDLTADFEGKKEFNYDEFREYLNELGDSLLVVSDDEVVKVHVHTEVPGHIFSHGKKFGKLDKIKVDNMRIQHENVVDESAKSDIQPVDFAVVAIAVGDGLRQLFESLGVSYVLSGGQTMNPSTQDIVDAVEKLKAKKAIILPNNGNIMMAAKQAKDVLSIPVEVVPAKTVSQGMSAMLGFDPDASLEDNAQSMTELIEGVTSIQVTRAIRDTEIDGVEIHNNDYMGLLNGKIVHSTANKFETIIETIQDGLTEDSEIVTIIIGEDGSEEEAQQLEDRILEIDEDLEVEIHQGDQPVYDYLISIE